MRRDESVARQEKFATAGEALPYEMAATAARAASEMFATDVTLIDLRGLVSYADYFVIASAQTERQTRRVAQEVIERMIENRSLYKGDGSRTEGGLLKEEIR